jgi:V8-like Glu-specific endopeptidase
MKTLSLPAIGILLLAGTALTMAKPKTTFPVQINPELLDKEPYRFNGVVVSGNARGSGFCAWKRRTFFSAAHVVFTAPNWGTPPIWNPAANSLTLDPENEVQSRGYYRFSKYSEIVALKGDAGGFGEDVIIGFAFKDLIKGSPATLNLEGANALRSKTRKMITGYPAKNFYTDTPIEGYFMHQTGPTTVPFSRYSYASGSVITSLITTGPGNSGGPIWSKSHGSDWTASGILVGGLPSETVVYAFSKDTKALMRAVLPVVQARPAYPDPVHGVSASSLFFPYSHSHEIPDGVQKWSSFIIGVRGFGKQSQLTSLKFSMKIETPHRGDLQVLLVAPGGYSALLHNEEGGGKDDLIFKDKDLTNNFVGIEADGKWVLRVQDRLKGDRATLKSFRLEIAAQEVTTATP